ncbi:DUF6880 family protein [Burkholderia cenocepacia]|uniref:DUF6880 family protein n=1 Tax=Burkholderia cenocepacia TaxID=95486 RepID=UPI000F5976D2|nr:DUF6880 family protein [Burkholderia cenocepacia]
MKRKPMTRDPVDELVPEMVIALGAARLAALLVDCAQTNASLRRQLVFERSVHAGSDTIASIRQWMAQLREDMTFLDREACRPIASEFAALRAAITTHVAPEYALELMWAWFTLAGTIADRTTEECWEIGCSCEQGCRDVVRLSVEADVEPIALITQMADALAVEHFGEYGALPRAIAALESSASSYLSQFRGALQRALDEATPGSTRCKMLQSLQQALA